MDLVLSSERRASGTDLKGVEHIRVKQQDIMSKSMTCSGRRASGRHWLVDAVVVDVIDGWQESRLKAGILSI